MDTFTNDERREVAERIRALPSDIYSTIKEWEKDGLFIDATLCDEADYSQIHNAVFGCFPAEYIHPGDREELHERLADLIDPTCNFEESPDNDEFAIRVVSGYICHSCGHETIVERTAGGWAEPPHYCSNCGARLVSDDE